MVSIRSTVALSALSAGANAATTVAADSQVVKMVELGVYVMDIANNLPQYYSFQGANPGEKYPPVIETAVIDQAFNGVPESQWITLLSDIDEADVQRMLTGVPWYSSRIAPALSASLEAQGIVIAAPGAAASTAAATTATEASAAKTGETKATSAPVTAAANGTIVTSKGYANSTVHETTHLTSTETSTVCDEVCQSKKSESAKTATSKASTAHTSTAKASTAKNGTSSTHSVTAATKNGAAAKGVTGVGAGVLGAVALLL
ncbi:SRP1/TIP1 family protein KNAG_0M00110 [Huiozyma naganishii CBS 8797]|uniref:Uncharacterized protein n=1 Tax=Huiozyma naganishii (strain ATCC MYA-139 / BCRC 22969 / CBS 8797 / KCTC 17520 / NBRC 10181 / NCYC 3082 / Yp74L-3) TaxID=1071383 RepID=J7SAM1_HUIN7|nr:hypothetical protein KNAG_0M00110 [Kazachstania naganishii CBS 8797]CCK72864.1 hypothetical protein KNAG_0M00110 [Kazachstania naganishii CBS 8797]